ncbi:holocarboxylase synthetase-like protein [Temnothorax americanus]|uniref:holocarboxylase synthetase-like protein n=1 Tax=Temnothorax americanus TaxID=1964332 RepID=UPI004067FF07
MLLTFIYMIATVMQARRITFLKAHLDAIFKGNQNRPSFTLKIKSSRRLKKDRNGYEQNEKFLSSHLCTNKNLAKLDELLWYNERAKLYTIYPQQKVDVSNWLTCPYGNSFPLYINNNCCQVLSESDLHILVEVDIETYGSKTSTTSAKLEDYGLIVAWTVSSRNMNFILKTDLEHITSFITGIMQGQYCINNGLFIKRVQSVLVSGKPRIYSDTGHLGPPPNKNSFYALCDAAQGKTSQQKHKPKEVVRVRGMSVQSQDNNLNTEFTDEFFAEVMKDIDASSSNSAPATCNSSPTKQHVGLTKKPYNLNHLPEDVLLAVTQGTSKNYTNVHLPDTEKKDNTDDEESEHTDQSKSTRETDSKSSELEEEEKPSKVIKPPNVLVCADSLGATDNLQNLLSRVLEEDRYVIHVFSKGEYDRCKVWIDQVSLVVLCGNVGAELGAHLVEYVIRGGKLLALCSDMLHILLPSFKTAEVRENELVDFSYGKWKRVRMMHHIFCYHASPIRTRFSQDHEDIRASALNPPTSASVKDKKGNLHSFDVKVLGKEETWHSPSILLATLPSSGGKVVFSQIHLEIDPMQYVYEGDKFDVLKKSNVARLEIISDLLSTHLGLDVNCDTSQRSVRYTAGYFLGKFEMKLKMLEKLKDKMSGNNVLKMSGMEIQFCANNENVQSPSANFLPVMMHMCPPNFSTVDYFENLYTKELGRLVIYADVLTSSMNAIDARLEHGLTVIPRQQADGRGRYSNKWLSPKGCAMFTLQIHISIMSSIGHYVSILQHVAAVALVSAVRSIKGYEDIDLRIKWPNDIYIGNSIKIGGIIVSTLAEDGGAMFICNIGAGINLSNSKPTTCINDAILQYNQKYGTKLETFSCEKYLAMVFNEMEILLDILHSGKTDYFYQLYYKYWLHTNSNVMVTFINGRRENVTILGIDNYGYLLVQGKKGMFTVHSDGNSFDVLKGLIVPKEK